MINDALNFKDVEAEVDIMAAVCEVILENRYEFTSDMYKTLQYVLENSDSGYACGKEVVGFSIKASFNMNKEDGFSKTTNHPYSLPIMQYKGLQKLNTDDLDINNSYSGIRVERILVSNLPYTVIYDQDDEGNDNEILRIPQHLSDGAVISILEYSGKRYHTGIYEGRIGVEAKLRELMGIVSSPIEDIDRKDAVAVIEEV